MEHDMDAGSVHCVVSSPPYWGGVRDYDIPALTWADGWTGDFGNEPTIDGYLDHTLEIFEGIRRVLRDDGVVFWNIGDTFRSPNKWGGRSGGKHAAKTLRMMGVDDSRARADVVPRHKVETGMPAGNKCLIPARVALALQSDGWIVRQDIVWRKRSPMTETLHGPRWERCRIKGESPGEWMPCDGCDKCEYTNGWVFRTGQWRPTTAHESIFMITKSNDYYCDEIRLAEPVTGTSHHRGTGHHRKAVNGRDEGIKQNTDWNASHNHVTETRNPRSVWSFSNEPYSGPHFAPFLSALVHKCLTAAIGAGGCCSCCHTQLAPVIEKQRVSTRPGNDSKALDETGAKLDGATAGNRDPLRHVLRRECVGYFPTCGCGSFHRIGEPGEMSEVADDAVPATVYDPFVGSGTTAQVAHHMGLCAIGSELGEQYLPLIADRIGKRPRCLVDPSTESKRVESLPGQLQMF